MSAAVPEQPLEGRVALVTGVTSGVGSALVSRLLAEGAEVIGLGRDAGRLAAASARWGERFTGVTVDLADAAARKRSIEEIRRRWERIDVIVNNAGYSGDERPLETPWEAWQGLFEVNLFAAMEIVHALVPSIPQGGHVINISSITTRSTPSPQLAPYAMTKAALERFTDMLRVELAPRGIAVSLVVPGLIQTPIYDKMPRISSLIDKWTAQVPTWLSAEDVASAIAWMILRPSPVVISELVIMPRFQAR